MTNEVKNQETTGAAASADEPSVNRYKGDALERTVRLRGVAQDIPDEADPRPLTPAELRLVSLTSAEALEKAALFAEAAPEVSVAVTNVADLRDAINFEFAYAGVRDEAMAVVRRIDHAIARRKLKAVKAARALYRVGKGYVTSAAGDSVRPHLEQMQRTLVGRRKKPSASPAEPEPAAKK